MSLLGMMNSETSPISYTIGDLFEIFICMVVRQLGCFGFHAYNRDLFNITGEQLNAMLYLEEELFFIVYF